MDDPIFLFLGYGAEYSLHPLCDFMTGRNDLCVEIDLMQADTPIEALKALEGQRLVLVTSAHPLYDRKNFFYYRTERQIVSVLHVISTLKPTASIFYPHDYKEPVKEEEFAYMPLFDLLLWPFAAPDRRLEDLVRTRTVGWIKNIPHEDARLASIPEHGRCVFFLGAYQFYLKAGVEKFYADFADLFAAGVAVKLPRWHGNEAFEEALASLGVTVYPSDANSIEVMRANDVIVAHALSSVALEACELGKSVIYITDDALDHQDPVACFLGEGNIAFVNSPLAASQIKDTALPRNRETMLPFDFEAARNAVWDEWKRKVEA